MTACHPFGCGRVRLKGVRLIKRLVGIAVVTFVLPGLASAATTWDFRPGSGTAHSQTGAGNYGNERTFTQDGESVEVTAWADTGIPPPPEALDEAWVGRFSTGLGICNQGEGSLSYCSDPLHQVDNVGQQDLMLFSFGTLQTFDSIVIDPFGSFDRDVTFWVGTVPDPLNLSLDGVGIGQLGSIGFGAQNDDYNGIGSGALTIDLLGLQGNVLLFGALYPPNRKKDRFKIRELTTSAAVVPVPPAVWLFTSALGLLGWVRYRNS